MASPLCDIWLQLFPLQEQLEEKPKLPIIPIDSPKELRPIIYLAAGAFGGMCSAVAGQPMDVVKMRLQTMPNTIPPKYTGTLDCVVKIFKRQGLRGFYHGLGIQITSVMPAFAVCFFGYGSGKSIQEEMGKKPSEFTSINYFIAGAFAGSITSCIMAPAERIIVILQVQKANEGPKVSYEDRCGPKYSGALDVVKQLYKQGGVRNLYKGAFLTFMRDILGYGTYFMTYETLKSRMIRGPEDLPLVLYKTVIAGGVAGIMTWIVALPCDGLKAKLQSAPADKYRNGLKDIFAEMYRGRGFISLYSGLLPVLLRAFPANAACFLGFEYCKTNLNNFLQ